MSWRWKVLLTRVAALIASVLALEACCRLELIDPQAVIPPSEMVAAMVEQLRSPDVQASAIQTFGTVMLAVLLAILFGAAVGIGLHLKPRLRRAVDPLLASYYSVPTFIFYPLLVALFGLNATPLVALGVLSATPAIIIGVLNGLDGVSPVLRKVARVHRLGPLRTLALVVLPAVLPALFSGFKLALSYALIGVIAGEFILSGSGLGYAISFAYQSFDTRAMYGLMLFVLLVAVTLNGLLYTWEGRINDRRRRQ